MSEERIKRKSLWSSIGNINTTQTWFKAVELLGFDLTQPRKGSSHFTVRVKGSDSRDIKGVITTIASHGKLRKDVNREIFKNFLNFGVEEDKIWKALEMLSETEE